jgi:hypothetical protein
MFYDFSLLVDIKDLKEDLGNETKILLEDYLSDAIKVHGKDNDITSLAHAHLGRFHAQRRHPEISESHYKEASRITSKGYGPNHFMTREMASKLSEISSALMSMT